MFVTTTAKERRALKGTVVSSLLHVKTSSIVHSVALRCDCDMNS